MEKVQNNNWIGKINVQYLDSNICYSKFLNSKGLKCKKASNI